MTVYLLHFDRPRFHARHYIGFCEGDPKIRLMAHKRGKGNGLVKFVHDAGIHIAIARVWEGRSRSFERKIKNRRESLKFCPICSETTYNPEYPGI